MMSKPIPRYLLMISGNSIQKIPDPNGDVCDAKDVSELEMEVELLNTILEGCPGCMAAEQGIESLFSERNELLEKKAELERENERLKDTIFEMVHRML